MSLVPPGGKATGMNTTTLARPGLTRKMLLPFHMLFLLVLASCGPVTPPEKQEESQSVQATGKGRTAGMQRTPGQPLYYVDWLGDVELPIGKKQPITVKRSAQLLLSGYALDQQKKTTAGGVDVSLDGVPYEASFGADRPDVAQYYKTPEYRNSGFKILIPGDEITPGRHSVSIRVLSSDGKTYWEGSPYVFDYK